MLDFLLYSGEEILERVDEYSLYCSYLEFEPLVGAKYHSPIRSSTGGSEDTDPSFGIYEKKYGKTPNEYMWKDQAIAKHGDIFDLVMFLLNLRTRREAMQQVLVDAGIVEGRPSRRISTTATKKFVGYSDISIKSWDFSERDLDFWRKFNIDKGLLKSYNVQSVKLYWLYADQSVPRYPKGIGFCYNIWDKKQLYFPWARKKDKFRTDWTEACVPGYLQLEYNSPLLIITKSMKDVMCLRSFGYEAIAARGESILLPKECIAYMKRKYERILVLFDNDMKHNGELYEFDKVYVPQVLAGDKDVSDFCNNHGAADTAEMLRTITSV